MLSAVFLDGCITVHDYKSKVDTLGHIASTKLREYEIAECFLMDYDKFIYLCNHIDERLSEGIKHRRKQSLRQVALFFSKKADKVLLLSFADNKMAVLYNAGERVELRPDSHRARAARNAEKRRLRLLQKNINMLQSCLGEDALELLKNLEKIHTTKMGIDRIKKNLGISGDAVLWCKEKIAASQNITRQGKNWYVDVDNAVITVNAHSYTIITAHKKG